MVVEHVVGSNASYTDSALKLKTQVQPHVLQELMCTELESSSIGGGGDGVGLGGGQAVGG